MSWFAIRHYNVKKKKKKKEKKKKKKDKDKNKNKNKKHTKKNKNKKNVFYLLTESSLITVPQLLLKKSQMAGSRLERFGTVFTRVRDLMRSGVIKPHEKPIWYDVYGAFPPKRDPLNVKPHTRPWSKKQETVPEIFYREDEVRAKFYEQYGTGPRPFDLSKSNFVSTCQRFIDKYAELKSNSELSDFALFEETGKALLKDGIMLRRKGAPCVSAESRDPVLELKLTDMLAEQQSVSADSKETIEHTTHTP